jgi:HSP20 family protein
MATVTRWDPFREMLTLRNQMDRWFDETNRSLVGGRYANGGSTGEQMYTLPLDVSENQNEYVVKASVPGIEPDAIEITVNHHVLTIQGEFKPEETQAGWHYHLQERGYGKFARNITLPTAINENQIQANFENGVLSVHLPKAEQAKPKRINVRGTGNQTIEGSATKS